MYAVYDGSLENWYELDYIIYEIENGMGAIKHMIEKNEDSLKEVSKEIKHKKSNIENDFEGVPKEFIASIIAQNLEREIKFHDELESYQRAGSLQTLYAFFEGKLKSICDLIEEEFGRGSPYKKQKGKTDIMRYVNYLKNEFKLTFESKIESSITRLNQHKVVRNVVTHENFIAGKENSKKIPNHKNLATYRSSDDSTFIFIKDKEYLFFILENIQEFFSELIPLLKARFNELKST